MRTPLGIAFDLDGTLLDSRLDIAAACNHVLVQQGRAALDPAQIATYVGHGVRQLLARAFELANDDAALNPLVRDLVAYYAAHPIAHTTWLPGAREALDAVADLPLAVLTNKARAVTTAILEALGVRALFAFVYAGGDGPLKPAPDAVLATARALSVDVGSLWVVGDGPQDIGAARAAGAPAIAVLGGFTSEEGLRDSQPDVLLASLHELGPLRARATAP